MQSEATGRKGVQPNYLSGKCLETINEKENANMDNYTNLTFDLIEEG